MLLDLRIDSYVLSADGVVINDKKIQSGCVSLGWVWPAIRAPASPVRVSNSRRREARSKARAPEYKHHNANHSIETILVVARVGMNETLFPTTLK